MDQKEEVLIRPRTSCVFAKGFGVACDEYIRPDGSKRFECCSACGWNPSVADARVKKFRRKKGMAV